MSLIDPAKSAASVTPSDSTTLNLTACLWVGTQGALAVQMEDGSSAIFVGAQGWMPLRVTKVLATGTDAEDIVAVWNA